MKKILSYNKKVTSFFDETIWDMDKKYPLWKEIYFYFLRLFYLVFRGITKNKSAIRATALAYETLLAIVPLIAVMLAIFKAFGGLSKIEAKVKTFILNNLATGTGEVVQKYLLEFIEKIHTGMGIIGFTFLVLTVLWLLSTIETAFDDIWGVQKRRSLLKRFTAYWTTLTLGPIFVALSIGLMGTLEVQPILTFLPHVMTWVVFTLVYSYLPNTRVSFRSAIIGGILAGSLWEFSRYGYTIYATHAETYKSIYGSLGALPIFLIWLYLSWIIVLIGAEISFADQNIKTYGQEVKASVASQKFKARLSLAVTAFVCKAYEEGEGCVTTRQLIDHFKISIRLMNEILSDLSRASILLETGEEERYYCPARSPELMTIKNVLDGITSLGETPSKFPMDYALEKILKEMDEALEKISESTNFKDIILKSNPA